MDLDAFARLLPPVTEGNRAYWEGLDAGELRLQFCNHDGTARFPESPVCPQCLSPDFSWRPAKGEATLWSWVIMHQKYLDAFDELRPYPVAFVKLAEGPFMVSTVIGDVDKLTVDAPLELVFTEVGARSVPAFQVTS
ncbi:Zn-ribbon domain-containing OB-fold protein [Gryllotalpicola reticulitermitis]|uniref:Zn-ribbon domain-containing OB-fold protein n=1 Tax=Gryllotalpicola reticulitermitis TaxID=1184153 RepID=A0ABV8Q2K8_9MICO